MNNNDELMVGRSVKVLRNAVIKSSAPELMRVEVEKTRRAFEIGRDCGLFRAPKVLEYNDNTGVAVFERLEGIVPLRKLVFLPRYKILIEQAGASLAFIHKKLTLPPNMIIPLPAELDLHDSEVFLHGDFNGANVCVGESLSSIVILDWQMTSRHGGQATYGSRYYDITWFVNYLLWTPTIRYLWGDPIKSVAKIFIDAYFKEAGFEYDTEAFLRYVENFFRIKAPYRKYGATWKTRYLLPRCHAMTRSFIQSLQEISP